MSSREESASFSSLDDADVIDIFTMSPEGDNFFIYVILTNGRFAKYMVQSRDFLFSIDKESMLSGLREFEGRQMVKCGFVESDPEISSLIEYRGIEDIPFLDGNPTETRSQLAADIRRLSDELLHGPDYTAARTPEENVSSVELRLNSVVKTLETNTITVHGTDRSNTQFTFDFSGIPDIENIDSENCLTRGACRVALNSNGTIDFWIGDRHIRSDTSYEAIEEYVRRLIESERSAPVGHSGYHDTTVIPDNTSMNARYETQLAECKKNQEILERMLKENPDMKCLCCNTKLSHPQNLVKHLGYEETEKYLQFCKKNQQEPQLYCCNCFAVIEDNETAFAAYRQIMDDMRSVDDFRNQLVEQENRLNEENRKLHDAKRDFEVLKVSHEKELAESKKKYLMHIIQVLKLDPKTVINAIYTADNKEEKK